jgi:hypothetical protein
MKIRPDLRDDFDEIIARDKHQLDFLRKFTPLHHGVPR